MAINYIEKGSGLHAAITAAGHWLRQVDGGVWISDNDAVVQAIIDAYNALPDAKITKVNEIKAEALRRIQLLFPAISDMEALALVREQWLSIAPAARQATPSFQRMIDIYQAAKNAATVVNGYTAVSQVAGYSAATDPAWPV